MSAIHSAARLGAWQAGAATTAGQRHGRDGRPCQDAARASGGPRPYVIVCDGRGSSPLSQHGAAAALDVLDNTLWSIEPLLARCLDSLDPGDPLAAAGWRDAAHVLLRALMREQEALARRHGAAAADFEFTLSAAIVGRRGLGVVQVGDSCVVLQRGRDSALAARPQTGEYAGETYFVTPDPALIARAETPLLSADNITGILCMSDGVSCRWLHHRTLEPAPGVSQVLERLATGAWTEAQVQDYLEKPFWHEGGDDDRGVAYLVSAVTAPVSAEPEDGGHHD